MATKAQEFDFVPSKKLSIAAGILAGLKTHVANKTKQEAEAAKNEQAFLRSYLPLLFRQQQFEQTERREQSEFQQTFGLQSKQEKSKQAQLAITNQQRFQELSLQGQKLQATLDDMIAKREQAAKEFELEETKVGLTERTVVAEEARVDLQELKGLRDYIIDLEGIVGIRERHEEDIRIQEEAEEGRQARHEEDIRIQEAAEVGRGERQVEDIETRKELAGAPVFTQAELQNITRLDTALEKFENLLDVVQANPKNAILNARAENAAKSAFTAWQAVASNAIKRGDAVPDMPDSFVGYQDRPWWKLQRNISAELKRREETQAVLPQETTTLATSGTEFEQLVTFLKGSSNKKLSPEEREEIIRRGVDPDAVESAATK